jgi:hypothetical protein
VREVRGLTLGETVSVFRRTGGKDLLDPIDPIDEDHRHKGGNRYNTRLASRTPPCSNRDDHPLLDLLGNLVDLFLCPDDDGIQIALDLTSSGDGVQDGIIEFAILVFDVDQGRGVSSCRGGGGGG